jgi:hypothetical protein
LFPKQINVRMLAQDNTARKQLIEDLNSSHCIVRLIKMHCDLQHHSRRIRCLSAPSCHVHMEVKRERETKVPEGRENIKPE